MGVTFDFSYDLTEQYKSVYGIEITVTLFYRGFFLAVKSQYIA